MARLLVLLALAFALTYGAFFVRMVVVDQPDHLFPAPLLWILLWSFAPLLAWFGLRLRSRDAVGGLTFMALAFFLDLSGLPSMGGGFAYAFFVAPLLLFALIAALRRLKMR